MSLDIGKLVGYIELDDSQADDMVSKFPDKLKGMGAKGMLAAAAVGVAVAGALAKGIGDAIDIEDANNKMAAQLGLSAPEAAKAGKIAGKLWSQGYGDSMADVDDALAQVIQQTGGFGKVSDKVLSQITGQALNISSIFGQDLPAVLGAAGNMVKNGLAPDFSSALDIITVGFQKSGQQGEDLLDTFTEYSTIFNKMGVDGQTAMGLISQGLQAGGRNSDAMADSLKELSLRAADGTAEAAQGFENLGVSAGDFQAAMAAGGPQAAKMLDLVTDKLRGIKDPVAQNVAGLALYGTKWEDNAKAILAFDPSSAVKGLGNLDGAAKKAGDTASQGVEKQWRSLQNAFGSIASDIGGTLLPVLGGLLSWMNQNPAVIGIIATALGVLAAAFVGVTVATWAMNTALLANPITWIILGIVALIAAIILLIANWDAVVAFIVDVWSGFISWFTGVMDGFFGWWNGVWAGFVGFIVDVWNGFIGFIVDVWSGFIGWIMDGLNAYNAFWIGIWTAVASFIVSVWNGFIGFVKDAFNNFLLGLRIIGDAIAAWWNGLWAAVSAFVTAQWNGWIGIVRGLFSGIASFFSSVGGGIASFFSGLWSGIASFAKDTWNNLINWLHGVPGWIKGVFDGAVSWLSGIGKNIIDGLWNGLKGAWDGVINWFKDAAGNITSTFKNILGIHSPSKVFEGFGINIGQGLVNGLDDLQPKIDSQIESMVKLPSAPKEVVLVGSTPGANVATTNKSFTYVAAPGSSLSTEEELFDALSRPRADF